MNDPSVREQYGSLEARVVDFRRCPDFNHLLAKAYGCVQGVAEYEHHTDAERVRLIRNIVAAVNVVRDERTAAAVLTPDADPTGIRWARPDAPEDGDLTQPGRIEPHTGGVTDGGLVDETPSETGERVEVGADGCGCPVTEEVRANGSSIDGTERVEHRPKCWARPDVIPPTDPDDLPCQPASGLTHAADQSRGPLAGTTPVVTYFSFGHGQTDPGTGKRLHNHYVTVVAPTYESCREAMFASRFGRAWSFDYLAGTARATEWIPLWTEHEVIVAPGTDLALADRALGEALKVLSAQVCADEEPF